MSWLKRWWLALSVSSALILAAGLTIRFIRMKFAPEEVFLYVFPFMILLFTGAWTYCLRLSRERAVALAYSPYYVRR